MDIVYDPLLGKPRMDDAARVKAPTVDKALDAESGNAVANSAVTAGVGEAKEAASAAKGTAQTARTTAEGARSLASEAKTTAASAKTAATQAKGAAERAAATAEAKADPARDERIFGNWTRVDRGMFHVELFDQGVPVGHIGTRGVYDKDGFWLDVDFDPFTWSEDFSPDFSGQSLEVDLPGYAGEEFEMSAVDPETYEPGPPFPVRLGGMRGSSLQTDTEDSLLIYVGLALLDASGEEIGIVDFEIRAYRQDGKVSVGSGGSSPHIMTHDGRECFFSARYPELAGSSIPGDTGYSEKTLYRPASETPVASMRDLAVHEDDPDAHAAQFAATTAACCARGRLAVDTRSGAKAVARLGPDKKGGAYIIGGGDTIYGTPCYADGKDLVIDFTEWFTGSHPESPVFDLYIARPTGYVNFSLENPAIYIRARTSMDNTAPKDYEVARFNRRQEDRYAFEIIHLQVFISGVSTSWPGGEHKNIRLLRRERGYSTVFNYQHPIVPELGRAPCYSECLFTSF